MKNLKFYYAVVCVLFLMGCEQESQDNFSPDPTTSMDLQMNSINEEGKITSHSPMDFPAVPSRQALDMRVNPNQIVTGKFLTAAGSKYNLAAVKNGGGVNGVWQIDSENLGHLMLKSICVSVLDNEAIIAAIVTEVKRPGVLRENYIAFLKVKDNGEGVNASPDQVSFSIVFYPDWFNFYDSVEDFLAVISCENYPAVQLFGPLVDRDGQIQVR